MKLFESAVSLYVRAAQTLWRLHDALFRRYYVRRFAACGASPSFFPLSSTLSYEHIRLGSNVYIGPGAIIGRARLGDDVMLGPNVSIRDGYHRTDVVGATIRESGGTDPGLVVVGNDVWIGEGAVLLRGASVGDGAVIGTKAIVTGRIPPYVVAIGSPALPVKLRFTDDQLREHLNTRGVVSDTAEALVGERAEAVESATLD